MEYDLPKLVAQYAERKARLKKTPVWAVVQEILHLGSTSSYEFCRQHLPKNGWIVVDDETPDGKMILACEELGDSPQKMRRERGKWYNIRGEELLYQPSWWKTL